MSDAVLPVSSVSAPAREDGNSMMTMHSTNILLMIGKCRNPLIPYPCFHFRLPWQADLYNVITILTFLSFHPFPFLTFRQLPEDGNNTEANHASTD